MNREQIENMEPGPELDALVAEKVMGWSNVWKPFFPSTDISAAWEVVEKFPIVNIERVEIYEGNVSAYCKIYPDSDSEDSFEAQCKTAPEAICKAALLAVMDQ